MVDIGAIRHICANKTAFSSYTNVKDREKHVYLNDSRTTPVLGKRKVLLNLKSGKTPTLSDVFHVSSIKVNLIFVVLLGKSEG